MDVWWLDGRFYVRDSSGRLVNPFRAESGAVPSLLPKAAEDALEADPMLTRAQAARFLKVASATLAEWATANKGPPYLALGREVQYPLSALREWLRTQLRTPGAPTEAPPPTKRPRGRPPKPRGAPAKKAARKSPKKAPKTAPRTRRATAPAGRVRVSRGGSRGRR
jgi:Helix-turn-helix domain